MAKQAKSQTQGYRKRTYEVTAEDLDELEMRHLLERDQMEQTFLRERGWKPVDAWERTLGRLWTKRFPATGNYLLLTEQALQIELSNP